MISPDFAFTSIKERIARLGESRINSNASRLYDTLEFAEAGVLKRVLVGDKLDERLRDAFGRGDEVSIETVQVLCNTSLHVKGDTLIYAISTGDGIFYAKEDELSTIPVALMWLFGAVGLWVLFCALMVSILGIIVVVGLFLVFPVLATIKKTIAALINHPKEVELRRQIKACVMALPGIRLL